MSSAVQDLVVSALINLGFGLLFLFAYSICSKQPVNLRVYFGALFKRDPNYGRDVNGIFTFHPGNILAWLQKALRMTQEELLDVAGLDAVMFLRIFVLGLKLFFPITIFTWIVLVPINATDDNVNYTKAKDSKSGFTDVDKLSLTNIRDSSPRLWAHVIAAYVIALWSYYILWHEYKHIATLRHDYMAEMRPQPDQFTVLVTNVPKSQYETVSEHVEHYFRVNHASTYFHHSVVINANHLWKLIKKRDKLINKIDALEIKLQKRPQKGRPMHKTGFLGLTGQKVDSIDYYQQEVDRLQEDIVKETRKVRDSQDLVVPASFVTFSTRWGAAVAAQTQQNRNAHEWRTQWAPEPGDVYWKNLHLKHWQRGLRSIVVGVGVFFLVFFYIIPVGLVQSLANLAQLRKAGTPIKQLVDAPIVSGFLSGFLPGLALRIFLAILPTILTIMSKYEGYPSKSRIAKATCSKMYYFQIVNVFFGSVLTGSLFSQFRSFIANPTGIPSRLGNAIPGRATFFITYIMFTGWAGFPAEILRLVPLILFHIRNMFMVTTEKDREAAMAVTGVSYKTMIPDLMLYMLLGMVYAPVSPLLLPFLLVYLVLGYIVYRNQVVNVYEREYESSASLWPQINARIITAMVTGQVVLIGIMGLKYGKAQGPALIPLPIFTVLFSFWMADRFEPAFKNYPLECANAKDILDAVRHPEWDLREAAAAAYLHPTLQVGRELEAPYETCFPRISSAKLEEQPKVVPVRRSLRSGSATPVTGGSTTPIHAPSEEGDVDYKRI